MRFIPPCFQRTDLAAFPVIREFYNPELRKSPKSLIWISSFCFAFAARWPPWVLGWLTLRSSRPAIDTHPLSQDYCLAPLPSFPFLSLLLSYCTYVCRPSCTIQAGFWVRRFWFSEKSRNGLQFWPFRTDWAIFDSGCTGDLLLQCLSLHLLLVTFKFHRIFWAHHQFVVDTWSWMAAHIGT